VALATICLLAPGPAASQVSASGTPQWLSVAVERLAQLRVRAAGSMKGYSRAKFGDPWEDVDHNHCDTRDDILERDLGDVAFKGSSTCTVQSGTLHDPYTGKTIHFKRGIGTSTAVQIDHVVALAAAWRTGAATWTGKRRLAYANDRFVLLAVDGPANEAKGDRDASKWLPPRRSFDCRYVAKQIAIKEKYGLWVTSAEHATMASQLARC
jgi:hypothetical protein